MSVNVAKEEVFTGEQLNDYITYKTINSLYGLPGVLRGNTPDVLPIDEMLLSRHMLLLGGIGSGKSNAFNHIIRNTRNILNSNDLMIIFDTKGDYYKEFYMPGDIVISNDPKTATDGTKQNYWNIFNEITIDDRVEDNILEISKGLFIDKITNTSQPFFPNAAKDLFSAIMLHIVRSKNANKFSNNLYLRQQINRIRPEGMVKVLKQHKDLEAMVSYISEPNSPQTQGVMAELQQCPREIFTGCFAKEGDISMRQLVKNKGGKVVFIEYDLSLGSVLIPIYRLLIDLAIKQALCRNENEGNVYFFLDEFRLLPHLDHIDDGVNFGRSLGAKFTVGIQNIDQVLAAYGDHEGRSILSGFGTTFAFKVNDSNSRQYIEELLGKNVKMQKYVSSIQSKGVSEQLREGFVAEDKDINSLSIGEAIVSAPTGEPFRFRFNLFQNH